MTAEVELLRIYKDRGQLTPELVVENATPTDSPLHDYFQWDDSAAGEMYRLMQARWLIGRCKIIVQTTPEETIEVRRFVNLPCSGSRFGEYVPLTEALSDKRRDVVLDQAVRELASVRRKYEALVDIEKAWNAARDDRPKRAKRPAKAS